MLIKDKYKPIFLNQSKINTEFYKKFNNLFSSQNNILNTIIHGPKGSGKFTLLKCLLNTLFKEDIICTKKIIKIYINNAEKEIEIMTSEYHFEIYLDKYLFSNKLYLFNLIDNITESKEINNSSHKIIVIRNVNHAPREFINYIKSKMEKIGASCIFFLTTNNLSKIGNSILGNFIRFRLPYPKKNELKDFINDIIVSENIKKKSNKFIDHLIDSNNSNLSSIMLNLEINLNNTSYKHDNLYDKNNWIKKIQEPNPENILYFRNEIYNLSSKNICVGDVIKDIIFYHLQLENIPQNKKIKIIEKYSELQKKIYNSYKDIVIYETILIYLFKFINQ